MTVNLPGVTAEIRTPERQDFDNAVNAVREVLPTPTQAAYYGGLGALVAFSLMEWPVAAAIGVGTAVAVRASGSRNFSASRSGQRGQSSS